MTGLPVAVLAAGAAGVLSAGVAAVGGGSRGALSAAVGAAVVVAFFGSGALPLLVVGGDVGRRGAIGTAVLLLTYTLRLAVAVAVLRAVAASDAVDPRMVGGTVIACALAWVMAQAVTVLRSGGTAGTTSGAARPPGG